MTLLHIIDTLCDVTTKQADLLREPVQQKIFWLQFRREQRSPVMDITACTTESHGIM